MLDEAHAWWLTGLTDGEGSFFATAHARNNDPRYARLLLVFVIGLRLDDLPSLQSLHEAMQVGRLYTNRSGGGRVNGYPQAQWRVTKLNELTGVIIPHFDAHPLRTKKGRDYTVWREIVLLARSTTGYQGHPQRRSPEDWERLRGLCKRLKQVRAYVEP